VTSSSTPSATLGGALVSDFKYLANNLEADGEDIVTAPLHISEAGELFTNPRFYLVVGAACAAFGGSFALDYTMRMNLKNMGSNPANAFQDASYASVIAAAGLLCGYGLYAGDERAREYVLTAGQGAASQSSWTSESRLPLVACVPIKALTTTMPSSAAVRRLFPVTWRPSSPSRRV
jgi:hypothetical protein